MTRAAIAYLDLDLDPALADRATRAAGMALEKYLGYRHDRPPAPEEPRELITEALARTLASPRIVPPIRVAVLHEPGASTPAAVRAGAAASTALALIASASQRVWLERRPPRGPVTPPWPGCEPIASGDDSLAAYRVPGDVPGAAIVARFAGADREWLHLLGDPVLPLDAGLAVPAFGACGRIVALVRRSRWVLTSHAVWPEWVPFCIYTEADPRGLPGLDEPSTIWIDNPRAGVAPTLPGSDDPAYRDVVDAGALRRAETIDLEDTRVVSVAELAAHADLRALSVAGCPLIHRDELGGLARLEELDLRRVPMRDYESLRSLVRLRVLRLDLRPRVGWSALAALPALAHLELRGIVDIDLGEIAENLPARALTVAFAHGARRSWSVDPLAAAPHLEALAVDFQDAELERLAALPRLRALALHGTLGADARLATVLAPLAALTGLSLGALASLRTLPALPALRRLDAAVDSLDGLDRLPALDSLELRHCGAAPARLAQPALTSLFLHDFDAIPAELFRSVPRLEAFGATGTAIDLDAVAALPALRHLELSDDDLDLAPVRHHPALECLVLRGIGRLDNPEALLHVPRLRRVVTQQPALPERVVVALEAQGVHVTTHPGAARFAIHDAFAGAAHGP